MRIYYSKPCYGLIGSVSNQNHEIMKTYDLTIKAQQILHDDVKFVASHLVMALKNLEAEEYIFEPELRVSPYNDGYRLIVYFGYPKRFLEVMKDEGKKAIFHAIENWKNNHIYIQPTTFFEEEMCYQKKSRITCRYYEKIEDEPYRDVSYDVSDLDDVKRVSAFWRDGVVDQILKVAHKLKTPVKIRTL